MANSKCLTRPSTIVQCKKRIALDGLHYVSAACVGGVIRRYRFLLEFSKYYAFTATIGQSGNKEGAVLLFQCVLSQCH